MPGLLADVNAEGHLRAILAVCRSSEWGEFWDGLDVTVHSFASVGLLPSTPDDEVWRWCRGRDTFLLTINRNDDGPTSLYATISARTSVRHLPVLTLANPDRVLGDAGHARDVALRLMEILDEVDRNRGSGRLWLP